MKKGWVLLRLAAVFALIFLLFSVPAGAESPENVCGEAGKATWNFDVETGILTVDGPDKLYSAPEEWYDLTGVTEIVIGDQITEVESTAFRYFDSVVKLTVGTGIRQVPFDILGVAATVAFRGEMAALDKYSSYSSPSYADTVIQAMSGSDMETFAAENCNTFVSLGSNRWTDGISNADQPVLDETTNTFTIRTARELAWLAWKTAGGNSLSGYTVELANDLDLSGKLWIPICNFEGMLDGKGHTIFNLRCAQGGLSVTTAASNTRVTICNLFLWNTDCNLNQNYSSYEEGVFCSMGRVQNCGAVGTAITINLSYVAPCLIDGYGSGTNAYAAVMLNGEFVGQYCDETTALTSMTLSQIQSADCVEKLNVLMEDAWDWKLGENGYPVLDPTSSRSWCNNISEVTPKDGVYYVETEEELAYIAQIVNEGNTMEGQTVKLMADLDLGGKAWTSIGCYPSGFSGTFDGNGHVITGLQVVNVMGFDNDGFFARADGTLQDIRLENVSIRGSCCGGLVGYMENGTITDCSVEGKVHGGGDMGVGGLAGSLRNTTVVGCYSCCDVVSVSSIGWDVCGGFVGEASGCRIQNCYATGSATAACDYVGGFIGVDYGSDIENCYAACDVEGGSLKPGMWYGSRNSGSTLVYSYWCSDNTMLQDGIVKTPVGVGVLSSGITDSTVSKTLAQMKQQSTFTGWDFETVWAIDPAINGGLPYLRHFGAQEEVTVTDLALSDETVSMKTGETWWLTVTTRPINATTKLTWESSAPAVASVSENGKVTALKAGTAVITVSGGNCSASCAVTVSQRQPEEYTIDSLQLFSEDNAPLSEIPGGSFFVRAAVTKTADAGSAVVMIAAYTDAGQMVDLVFLEADVPGGTTYSLGTWLDNTDGKIGKIKTFILSSLDVLTPLAAVKTAG